MRMSRTVLVCHERHIGDEGRPLDRNCTGKSVKQPNAAAIKSCGSERLRKRL